MAKTPSSNAYLQKIQAILNTVDTKLNAVLTEFYLTIRKHQAWPDPLKYLTILRDLSKSIVEMRSQPIDALEHIKDKFKEEKFGIKHQIIILGYIHEYCSKRPIPAGLPPWETKEDSQKLYHLQLFLDKEILELKKQLGCIPESSPVNTEETLEDLIKIENKFWEEMPIKVIVRHFETLTKQISKNGDPYLSEKMFVSFIKRGFLLDESQPIQRMNCGHGENGLIIKHFHSLYVEAKTKYNSPLRRFKLILLIMSCFNNWTEKQILSLFKQGKTRKKL